MPGSAALAPLAGASRRVPVPRASTGTSAARASRTRAGSAAPEAGRPDRADGPDGAVRGPPRTIRPSMPLRSADGSAAAASETVREARPAAASTLVTAVGACPAACCMTTTAILQSSHSSHRRRFRPHLRKHAPVWGAYARQAPVRETVNRRMAARKRAIRTGAGRAAEGRGAQGPCVPNTADRHAGASWPVLPMAARAARPSRGRCACQSTNIDPAGRLDPDTETGQSGPCGSSQSSKRQICHNGLHLQGGMPPSRRLCPVSSGGG